MNAIETLLSEMWKDYIAMTPQAQKIKTLFEERGEKVVNDHIALRTLNHPKLTIDKIAKPFIKAGYKANGEYHFEQKKLYAKHFEHPSSELPKIFISELLVEKFSQDFQDILNRIASEIPEEVIAKDEFTFSGKNWDLSSKEYELQASESEYGSWLAAIGFRPNHFTVFVNALKTFKDVEDVNSFLKEKGFALNSSGGEVKGSESDCLKQSSTIADQIKVELFDKEVIIPSCYFEFAKRFPMENGELYQGFVASSADKIFESTDRQK